MSYIGFIGSLKIICLKTEGLRCVLKLVSLSTTHFRLCLLLSFSD